MTNIIKVVREISPVLNGYSDPAPLTASKYPCDETGVCPFEEEMNNQVYCRDHCGFGVDE